MQEQQFWEQAFSSRASDLDVDVSEFDEKFLDLVGDPAGKKCLEIGCGGGELSCILASRGGHVLGIDGSSTAIEQAKRRAEVNGLSGSAEFLLGDLRQLDDIVHDRFDLIVGKFVLHHIEPISALFQSIYRLLDDRGRGIFYENSANNALLMWGRENLVGKYGIPKFGDNDEAPLSHAETSIAEEWFDVDIVYPKFVFFGLVGTYLLRSNHVPAFVQRLPWIADELAFRYVRSVRQYSYHKIVCLRHREVASALPCGNP